MQTLNNKVAIITGGSRGIGLGIAKVFVKKGAKVILASRDEGRLQAAQKLIFDSTGVETGICKADVTKSSELHQLVDFVVNKFSRLDIMCHNAGIFPMANLSEMTEDHWDRVIDTNLKGTFNTVSACIPVMKKQRYGRIVVTSSITGPRVATPGWAHYAASKGGVNAFVKVAAMELAPYSITINCVEPGTVLTEPMLTLGEKHIRAQESSVPLGRLCLPEEVGYASAYLASDEAAYVTGQSIILDGGQTLPESHYDILAKR